MSPSIRYAYAPDGAALAYTVTGDGPLDLLYVPQSISATEHLREHPTVAGFFERLACFSRLITFDRRGSGMSERLEHPIPLEEQVDDVRVVLDAVGAERPAVFALMEGGPMAMLFAASMPERVSALVLYACFARTTFAEGYEWARPPGQRAEAMERMHQIFGSPELIGVFAPKHAEDTRLATWMARLQRSSMAPRYSRRVTEMNAAIDVRPVLGSIRVPTLVLHRAADPFMDPRHSRYLAQEIPQARLVELPGDDTLPFLGDTDAVIGEIEEFLTGERTEMEPDRILATVLFTDICGSTERAAELGDRRWRQLLSEHDAVVRARLARHQGREIKSVGDGFLATFDGPARAVRAARGIVTDARALGLDVRAGLHTGEVEVIGDDVGGLAVHLAARVLGAAGNGEVVVSSTVKDLVVGSGLTFADRGEHALRGVPGAWRLWALEA